MNWWIVGGWAVGIFLLPVIVVIVDNCKNGWRD